VDEPCIRQDYQRQQEPEYTGCDCPNRFPDPINNLLKGGLLLFSKGGAETESSAETP
jgi:hypothetical protein